MEIEKPIEKAKRVLVYGETIEVRYRVWEGPAEPAGTLFCAHGAIRNYLDFLPLARAFARTHRVVAIDFPGHGHSDWLADKTSYHARDIHLQAAGQVLLSETVGPLIYVGTSMGGLVGLQLAALERSPIDLLILNDIAPEANAQSEKMFMKFLATDIALPSRGEAQSFVEKYIKVGHALGSADADALFEANMRHDADGQWRLNFDPDIKAAYREGISEGHRTHWGLWERIACPVLLLRGGAGSFVDPEIVTRMGVTHPDLTAVEVPEQNHPPDLASDFQIQAIRDWISERKRAPLAA